MRILISQPSLARYRVPLYRMLNECTDIEVRVAYSSSPHVPNSEPDGFEASQVVARGLQLGRRRLTLTPALLSSEAMKDIDVVVFSWNVNELLLLPALALCRQRNIGSVVWGHGYSLNESALRKAVRVAVARRADSVLTYDTETAVKLRSEAGLDNVFTAQNTIDTAPMQEEIANWPAGRIDEFKAENGLEDALVVLNVGRLIPERHLPVLLTAIASIQRNPHPVVGVIVGDGPEKEGLIALADELGLEDRVRFVDGTYDETHLAPWFLSASVFCSPSHLGLSVIHAFAYGLPVVTGDELSRHPPEAKAVVEGENGILFAHDDAADLARTLGNLAERPEQLSDLAVGAFRTATEHFTLRRMVEGFEDAARSAFMKHTGDPRGEQPMT